MRALVALFIAATVFPMVTSAASACATPPGYPGQIYNAKASGKIITYYVPHNAPNCKNSIEGCIETSCPGLPNKIMSSVAKPTCLDAVRLGQAKYVTLASDQSNYGKYFAIGTITYRSGLDGQMYTVNDVVGYVHDTGSAFRGRPDKIDVCTTVCPGCSDATAGALAQGKNVSLTPSSQGIIDTNNFQYTPTYGNPANPYSPVSASPFSGLGASAGQSAGTGAPLASSPAQGSPLSIGSQLQRGNAGNAAGAGSDVISGSGSRSAATIFVQPSNVKAGNPMLVSWTSVNMKPASCKITKNNADFATGNEATKRDTAANGSITYTLECTTAAGDTVKASSSVVIQ